MENYQKQSMGGGSPQLIHIIRHGQSFHNVDRDYKFRDPYLTEAGIQQASRVKLPARPDLVLVSPMTRTIQTAKLVFRRWLESAQVDIQVWPDLREAHDAICNQGVSRVELEAKFPDIDFARCPDEWTYPPHSFNDAAARAERVRNSLKVLSDSGLYQSIYLVTHRGFISFLVQGERFEVCECRSFHFASDDEAKTSRFGINQDTSTEQDFGPTLLAPQPSTLPSSEGKFDEASTRL